jgi:IS1 family transposase
MNKLPMSKRVAVVSALVEGNSLRSTCRMTGVAMNTVLKLLADLGEACATYHEEHVRKVNAKRIQCDEIWQFVYAKAKNVPEDKQATFGYGDVWTWTALDADSKLMVSYLVGPRTPNMCYELMKDVAGRLVAKVQLTTDGLYWYPHAVEHAFGIDVDYAVQTKKYGGSEHAGRYSPPKFVGSTKEVIRGNPDPRHISTSLVERQNLTMRMGDAPVYAAHEWLFKEGRESRLRRGDSFPALQLRPRSQDAARDARDGSGPRHACVEHRRNRRPVGQTLALVAA